MRPWQQLSIMALALATPVGAAPTSETLTVPAFGKVVLYAPAGPPQQVVLFVSGDGGWERGVIPMAERLRDLGALVAGIDVRSFLRSLEASKDCAYPAGALEELSRTVQQQRHLPAYLRPILVGYSSGATLVYAALAAAPPETFAGAISLGFCPDLELRNAPCRVRGLEFEKRRQGVGWELRPFAGLRVPWGVLQGQIDQVCSAAPTAAFVAATGAARLFPLPKVGHGFSVPRNWDAQYVEAYQAIAEARRRAAEAPPSSVPETADLGLVELPAAAGGHERDLLAVVLSGDGGWAEIDKGVAAGLAAAGVPVVGWSSLRYFWTPRTPEGAAADLARVIEHYAATWKKERVLLVGYSFGADALPFLVNRLPASARARVAGLGLLGLSGTASFEFHVSSWLGGGGDPRRPTAPEVKRLGLPATCVYGSGEEGSGCRALEGGGVRVVAVGHGHHFGGDYDRIAELLLAGTRR